MGVQINGDTGNISATKADYSGNVTIGGTLTYEDVTNIDSVGLVTARQGIEVGARPGVAASISVDGNMIVSGISTFGGDIKTSGGNIILGDSGGSNDDRIKLGAGGDLSIYHDGSNSYLIDSGDGDLIINSDSTISLNPNGGGHYGLRVITNGSCELYEANSKKLETTSTGVTVTGTVAATSFTGSGAALTGISAGITEFDHWYVTSDISSNGDITSNLSRVQGSSADVSAASPIGSGMSQSSGIFTFPSTGKYLVIFTGTFVPVGNDSVYIRLQVTTNNSSFTEVCQTTGGQSHYSGGSASSASTGTNFYFLDVTDTSNVKVKFTVGSISGSSYVEARSAIIRTGFIFARLGDT